VVVGRGGAEERKSCWPCTRKKLSISRQACEKNDPALLYVPESSRMQSSQQEVDDCVEGVIENRIYREEFSKGGRMHHKHVSGHLGSSRGAGSRCKAARMVKGGAKR